MGIGVFTCSQPLFSLPRTSPSINRASYARPSPVPHRFVSFRIALHHIVPPDHFASCRVSSDHSISSRTPSASHQITSHISISSNLTRSHLASLAWPLQITKKSCSWLIAELKNKRKLFGEEKLPLSSERKRQLKTFHELLIKGDASLKSRSTDYKCRRVRVRYLLSDVRLISQEVIVLCIFATTITQLAKVTQKRLLKAVSN